MPQGDKRGRATRAVRCKGAHGPPESLLPWGRWYEASPLRTRRVTARRLARGARRGRRESLPLAAASASGRGGAAGGWRRRPARCRARGRPGRALWPNTASRWPGGSRRPALKRPRSALSRWRAGAPGSPRPRDGSAAQEGASASANEAPSLARSVRQGPYCHHLVEQEPRAVKRGPRPIWGAQRARPPRPPAWGARSGTCARSNRGGASRETTAALGYALAASAPHRQGHRSLDDLLRKMCDTTPTRAPGLGLPLGRWVAPLQELLSELLLAVSEEQSLVKL